MRVEAGVAIATSCPSRMPSKAATSKRDAVASSTVSLGSAMVQRSSLLDARSCTMRVRLRRLDDQCTELPPSPSRHGRTPSTSPSVLPRAAERSPASFDAAAVISSVGPSGAGATAMGSMPTVNLRRVQNKPGAPVAITSMTSSLTMPGVGKTAETSAWPASSKSRRPHRSDLGVALEDADNDVAIRWQPVDREIGMHRCVDVDGARCAELR